MSDVIYSVWLQQCIGYASPKIKSILSAFGSSYNVFIAGDARRRASGLFTPKLLEKMRVLSLDKAQEIVDSCRVYGYKILSIEDEDYPDRLYEIDDPPCVLYVSGNMPDVDSTLTIGVVGTRTATSEGIRNSFTFGRDLSGCGAIVVSGGALGVDCASHRGALQNDGVTVCVLGCGINYDYLRENAQMRRLITKRGAVISEYPPDTAPASYHFPERNRIISGLSNGILVIEAGLKSGSLITARLALEQNRDVFSIPGSLINAKAQGSNALLKQGAITVTSYKDIIDEYAQKYDLTVEYKSVMASEEDISDVPVAGKNKNKKIPNNPNNTVNQNTAEYIDNKASGGSGKVCALKKPEPKCPDGVSGEAQLVFNELSDTPLYVDQISDKLDISPQTVMAALTELEIFGAAENVTGGRYIRKNQED